MALDIHKIQLDPASRNLLTTQNKFPDLRRVFRQIANEAIQAAADYGLDTVKSTVPWDTLTLRGSINSGQIKSKVTGYTAKVYVTSESHTGRGRTQPADSLARILQSGINEEGKVMHRTQDSLSLIGPIIGKGSPTKHWINFADTFFVNGIDRYLNQRTRGTYT